MGKKSVAGSGMNNPDRISKSLETIFGLKYFNSLIRIRDEKNMDPGKNNPDPQHWESLYSINWEHLSYSELK
jgi:hypothetical protein